MNNTITIPSSKELHPKLKQIFITKEARLPVPKIRNTTLSNQTETFKTYQLKNNSCTETRSITRKWKKFFPPLTTEFSFLKDTNQCNYLMMLFVLKIYQPELFKDLDIFGLKTLLVQFYSEHLKDPFLKTKILNKFKNQQKKKESLLLKSNTPIDTIIHNETYQLSEIDICLIMWHIKIPIVIYFQSKKSVRCFRFSNSREKNKHFFIRIGNGDKRGYQFNLNKIKLNPLIDLDSLKKHTLLNIDMKQEIINNTLHDFTEYLSLK